jgi:polyisoprenoid-binding protein YceI
MLFSGIGHRRLEMMGMRTAPLRLAAAFASNLALPLAALLAFAPPLPAQSAQSKVQIEKWQIDAAHSTAAVSLLSSAQPQNPLSYGIAMVGGTVSLDAANLSKLSFTLNIFPAEQAPALLNPDGTWRAGGLAQLSRYTLFTFESKPAVRASDVVLRLTGSLTITHVVRTAPAEGNVSYSGPSAIRPEVESFSREATFILEKPASDLEYGWKVGWMEIKGLGTLSLEDAPGLQAWLADSVWPPAVLDRRCHTPTYSVSMRDYRGTICTGTLVAMEKPRELPRSNSTVDYAGARYATPEKVNQLRLTLDLKLQEPR